VSKTVFRRTLLRYVRLVAWDEERRPFQSASICRLYFVVSLVCDIRAPYTESRPFQQYFAPHNSLGTWAVCIKILGKIHRNSRWSCAS